MKWQMHPIAKILTDNDEMLFCPGCNCWFNIGAGIEFSGFFTFRKGEDGLLKLKHVSCCIDCGGNETFKCKLNASKWLDPIPDYLWDLFEGGSINGFQGFTVLTKLFFRRIYIFEYRYDIDLII